MKMPKLNVILYLNYATEHRINARFLTKYSEKEGQYVYAHTDEDFARLGIL